MEEYILGLLGRLNDHMSCVYRGSQLQVSINFSQDSVPWSDGENAQTDLCFSASIFFLRCQSRILDHYVSPHSTQLMLITTDCAVIKVFKLLNFF